MNSIAQLAVPRETKTTYTSIEQTLRAEILSNGPIRLHCNETPFDLPEELKQQLVNKIADMAWNHYPDFHNTELTALIANQAGVQPENVVLGNGSSQLIQQIVNCCSKFLSVAVIENPTFTFYHQVCQNERMPYQEWVLAEDGSYDLSTFPQITEPALVILTSPNNPTGATLPLNLLQTLLEQHPSSIFVVDEAYGEFGGVSAMELVKKYANLLVLKTLSKGLGLPSIRFGYVVGSTAIIQVLKKYTVPFTVNIFTELVVREALTNPAFISALRVHQERIKNLRDFVYHLLSDMASDDYFTVQPSAANFLLLRFHHVEFLEEIKEELRIRNILVSYPIPQALRLTIGTETQMRQVIGIIRKALAQCQNYAESTAMMQY
jgi:histidinol-phosphate aminotransferase